MSMRIQSKQSKVQYKLNAIDDDDDTTKATKWKQNKLKIVSIYLRKKRFVSIDLIDFPQMNTSITCVSLERNAINVS